MGQWDIEQIRTHCIDDDGLQFVSGSRRKAKKKTWSQEKRVFIFRFRFFLVPADINNKQIKMSEKRSINEETLDIRNFTAAQEKKKVNVYVCI